MQGLRGRGLLGLLFFYAFALFNFCLYLGLSIQNRSFFKKNTEQDQLQLAIARDKFWNLSKTVVGLSHRFYRLRDGRQLHYLISRPARGGKPLVILIHGFPDSCMVWRHLLEGSNLLENATVVAADMPGHGASDGFDVSTATKILDALTEFIVAMREEHIDSDATENGRREDVILVGHDWGCATAYRLAAESPNLADRWILSNGPMVSLALANKDRILESSSKIFRSFLSAPIAHRSCLKKSLHTLQPLLIQLLHFGYIYAFHLPAFMVKFLGTGGNFAFLRGALRAAYGKDKSEFNLAESLACTLGPGPEELQTQTRDTNPIDLDTSDPPKKPPPSTYSPLVHARATDPGTLFYSQTSLYRDGLATHRWEKSLETIAALYNIEVDASNPLHRKSSSASSGIFEPYLPGTLRAPATIVWGQRDQACTQRICLDGIGDYLAKGSQVVLLPRTGHWTPVEREGRGALRAVIEWYVGGPGEKPGADIEPVVQEVYKDARVIGQR